MTNETQDRPQEEMPKLEGKSVGPEAAAALPAPSLTQDEMTMAALAHGSIILGFLSGGIGGILGALVIWLTQKEKSAYVAFQYFQAMVFQAAVLVLTILVGLLTAFAWVISGVLTAVVIGLCLMPLALLLTLVLIAIPLGGLAYGLYGAYDTYQGHDFRYWLVADLMERK